MLSQERVSLRQCSALSSDDKVVLQTLECIRALGNYGDRFANARSIVVKINAGVHNLVYEHGKTVSLTDPAVVEGTIRALREVTDAEILVGDATTDGDADGLYRKLGLTQRLASYPGVRLVDFSASELVEVPMRHPDAMFKSYFLPREVAQADAIVSVAKMKAHLSVGFTLCIKNLFGLMPMAVYGSPRLYLHDKLVRLPRVLSDMAQWMNPCLNVVDGIVASAKREWGGETLTPGVILAGTNIVATDSVGARVMGFEPTLDYPQTPFFYRRNPVKLAAQAGLGPQSLTDIELIGPDLADLITPFEVDRYGGETRRDEQLARGAKCVELYREQQDQLAKQFAGRYLAFLDDQILWDGPDMASMLRLEHESGRNWKTTPNFIVRCVPPHEEIENFQWYQADA